MSEDLKLPVTYKGIEHEYPLRVAAGGYVPRFIVEVEGVEVVIERDDAGELRAVVYNPDEVKEKLPERGLFEAITSVVAQLIS